MGTKTFLLVISSPTLATELAARLEAHGHTVAAATTSVALRTAVAAHARIDAVVVDVKPAAESIRKVLAFLRKALPPDAAIYVTPGMVQAVPRLEDSLDVERLGASLADLDTLVARLSPPDEQPQMARYDANVINCFVSAAGSVLEYYTQQSPEPGQPYIVPFKKVPAGYVSAVVTMAGKNLHGAASLSCDKDLLVEIAARISGLGKTAANRDRDALLAAATDMADQVFGKAESLLGKLGFVFALGAPEVRADDVKEIVLKGPAPALVIPFALKKKKFYIGFSLAIR